MQKEKLTPEQKAELINDSQTGEYTQKQLSIKYSVSIATIHNIRRKNGLVKKYNTIQDNDILTKVNIVSNDTIDPVNLLRSKVNKAKEEIARLGIDVQKWEKALIALE